MFVVGRVDASLHANDNLRHLGANFWRHKKSILMLGYPYEGSETY